MPKKSDLGKRIKEFRMDRQMTQERAASYFGVSRPTIARLEAGRGVSDLNHAKIEKILAQSLQAA